MTHSHCLLNQLAMLLVAAVPALAIDPPIAQPPAVDPAEEVSQIPSFPQTPKAVNNLLYARPFKLDEGYESEWRSERPLVSAGWVLVLEVDPALVFPRQTAEPILYVGTTTAERINLGHESGRVIAIVPSALNPQGEVALDLNQAMMWFGAPGLPEQVDAARIESERQAANAAKIAPFTKESVDAARAKAGVLLHVPDRTSLRRAAAELIKTYSPQEAELVELILAEAPATEQDSQPKN